MFIQRKKLRTKRSYCERNYMNAGANDSSSISAWDCEVRFAVVLYGGISLAIYINGVVNQLLKMAKSNKEGATGVQAIYQEVANELAKSIFKDENYGKHRVRLAIDIISGSSAGGINGIFLAKAIANNQSMEELKSLWIEQGDIAKLINDKEAIKDGNIKNFSTGITVEQSEPIRLPDHVESLLSGDRMYRKLCEALYGMGNNESYAERVDLFITATNFYGRDIPIQLANMVAWEKRHKHVFHLSNLSVPDFNFTSKHFSSENVPFLAFAARSTSAFPFAFEPINFKDITRVFPKKTNDYNELFLVDNAKNRHGLGLKDDAFVDGGCLDNKPFSYVLDAISRRKSDIPVIRKLLYVEPSPEEFDKKDMAGKKPNAFENAWAAASTLPRYETITEDIQRVGAHNNLVTRFQGIISDIERDFQYGKDETHHVPLSDEKWSKLDLADMIKKKGAHYSAYQRLDVSSLTDYLANALCKAIGFREQSAFFQVFRELIRAWRDKKYKEYREDGYPDVPTRNEFLYNFNLPYHLRREAFVQQKIDAFFAGIPSLNKSAQSVLDRYNGRRRFFQASHSKPYEPPERVLSSEEVLENIHEIHDALLKIKKTFHEVYNSLREYEEYLLNFTDSGFHPFLRNLKEDVWELKKGLSEKLSNPNSSKKLLGAFRDLIREGKLPEQLGEFGPLITKLQNITENYLKNFQTTLSPKLISASASCDRILETDAINGLARNASISEKIVATIKDYYQNYDDMDMIILPILYGTDIGEGVLIDVHRVSPRDATFLIDEKKSNIKKLAGASFGDFGAFFSKDWRVSDMLWGELDGAECIIRSLIPDEARAEKLISRAHKEILTEALKGKDADEQQKLLCALVINRRNDSKPIKTFSRRLGEIGVENVDDKRMETSYDDLLYSKSRFPSAYAFTILKRSGAVVTRMAEEILLTKKNSMLDVARLGLRMASMGVLNFCRYPRISVMAATLLGLGCLSLTALPLPCAITTSLTIIGLGVFAAEAAVFFLREKIIGFLSKSMPNEHELIKNKRTGQ
jgi:patatin-related protein